MSSFFTFARPGSEGSNGVVFIQLGNTWTCRYKRFGSYGFICFRVVYRSWFAPRGRCVVVMPLFLVASAHFFIFPSRGLPSQ